MTERNSYHTILRSSSIIGAASVINILTGLVRMKAAAILLGPAGVGLIGLFNNLMDMASTVADLGFVIVGTRQIAAANAGGRNDEIAAARRALFWGTLGLALAGGLGFFLLRDVIAVRVVDDPPRATEIGWLAIGVVLSVAAGSQGALLTGLRRIGDQARIRIASGILSAIIGVAALLIWGERGLVVYVVAGPLAGFVLGHWYVSRLGRITTGPTPLRELTAQWKVMVTLGGAFMISGLVTMGGFLIVRSLVQRELGADALGQFQASWTIGMTYLGFVLGAIGTDYYPRLTACIHDPKAACRLVNEQTEVALLLTGPVLIAMLALAPWVIRLLYTAEFGTAVEILRWQLLGDILKVMSWPLGFVILAAGAGKTFIVSESVGIGVFVLGVALGMAALGVMATGVAFLALYAVYLPLVHWLARRRIGFMWAPAVLRQAAALVVAVVAVSALAHWSEAWAAALGVPVAVVLGLYALGRLGAMAELSGPIGRLAALSRRVMGRMGVKYG